MASLDVATDADIDINQLSEDQQLALQQYTSVTNQDVQAAVPLLQRSQWNVEIAVTKFFDGEGPDIVAEALAAQNAPPPPRAAHRENLQHSLLRDQTSSSSLARQPQPDAAPRIVPQPADQVIPRPSLILAVLFTPFRFLYKIFSLPFGLFAYFFSSLPIFRRNAAAEALRRGNASGRRQLSPADTAQRVQREFSEEYGDNDLPWTGFGYATSLDYAKREHGFLIVVLLSPEHDDTSTFCREVLMNPEVNQFIQDPKNMIRVWVGDVRDAEAYQVATALKCSKFPFTALICNTPEVNSTTISVVSRIVGPMDPNTYLAKLRSAHAARVDALEQGRAAHALQNAERNLRQEQDSAYERSLAQDRERARLRREAEAAANAAEKRKQDAERDAAILATNKEQWRKWRVAHIAPEPSADEKDVVRIALKMPEAARVMRRFRASDPIDDLYAFVECYDYIKEGSSSEKVPERPETYEHRYNFQIVSTLPRVVYDVEQGGTIGQKVGKSGNLIVENITDDYDDIEGE